jgi:hypothetical protein
MEYFARIIVIGNKYNVLDLIRLFYTPYLLPQPMQLSEDGNFMWNGTEWVPVEAEAEAPAAEAPAVEAPAPAEMAAPEAAPMEIATPGAPAFIPAPGLVAPAQIMVSTTQPKPAINMAAALSVFKYGIIALAGWFVSMILLTIVWYLAFDMALQSDSATTGMIILVVATLVTIIAYGQMIIYPVGKALKDGRTDNVSFSYIDSWKTSIAGFIESVVVTATLAVMIGVGIGYEIDALSIIGAIGYFFFIMGYVPYMVRKAAEIMR